MKFPKIILSLVAVIGLAVSAQAQLGFDQFTVPRVVEFDTNNGAAIATANAAAAWSNAPVDIRPFIGGTSRAAVLVNSGTYAATTGTLTFQVFGSPDTTNWYAISNFAVISTPTKFITTNANPAIRYGTNASATNYTMFPFGAITYPTGATAGFTTPYAPNLSYTSNSAVSCTVPGWYEIGFNLPAQYSYLNVYFLPSTTSGSNFWASAVLIATPSTPIND